MNEHETELYGYFLPTDADIDHEGVLLAMRHLDTRVSFFLDLGTGNIIDLLLPRDQELYDNMKQEVFAFAEIPRFSGIPSERALEQFFQTFITELPVTVEKDFAEICKDGCDCFMCERERNDNL